MMRAGPQESIRSTGWFIGGGDDRRGVRLQIGVALLKKAMDGLSFKGGYEVALDDATNTELVPELVKQARQVEMGHF